MQSKGDEFRQTPRTYFDGSFENNEESASSAHYYLKQRSSDTKRYATNNQCRTVIRGGVALRRKSQTPSERAMNRMIISHDPMENKTQSSTSIGIVYATPARHYILLRSRIIIISVILFTCRYTIRLYASTQRAWASSK